MRGRPQRPTSVADLVARFFAKRHGHPDRDHEATLMKVFVAFSKIGPPITDHAEPILLRGGILTVNVTDSAWLTELTFLKQQILERVNAGLSKPAVRDVRMKLGTVQRKKAIKAPEPVLTEAEAADIQEWASMIGKDEVREAMMRAAKWTLRRPKPKLPILEGPPGPQPAKKEVLRAPQTAAGTRGDEPGRSSRPAGDEEKVKDRWDPARDRWKKK